MVTRLLATAMAWPWTAALATAADPAVTIEPVVSTLPPDTPTIPWIAAGDQGWHAGKPLFELAEQGVDITAKGWIAVSDAAILWHVVVDDPHQTDPKGGASMWAGDALQLGIESLGDSDDEAPKGEAAKGVHLGLHDGDYCIARSGGKPAVWSYYHARGAGAKPQVTATIDRDDSAATTTYDFAIPWTDFGVAAGLAPSIKVALHEHAVAAGTRAALDGSAAARRPALRHVGMGGDAAQRMDRGGPGDHGLLRHGPAGLGRAVLLVRQLRWVQPDHRRPRQPALQRREPDAARPVPHRRARCCAATSSRAASSPRAASPWTSSATASSTSPNP